MLNAECWMLGGRRSKYSVKDKDKSYLGSPGGAETLGTKATEESQPHVLGTEKLCLRLCGLRERDE